MHAGARHLATPQRQSGAHRGSKIMSGTVACGSATTLSGKIGSSIVRPLAPALPLSPAARTASVQRRAPGAPRCDTAAAAARCRRCMVQASQRAPNCGAAANAMIPGSPKPHSSQCGREEPLRQFEPREN